MLFMFSLVQSSTIEPKHLAYSRLVHCSKSLIPLKPFGSICKIEPAWNSIIGTFPLSHCGFWFVTLNPIFCDVIKHPDSSYNLEPAESAGDSPILHDCMISVQDGSSGAVPSISKSGGFAHA